MTQYVDTASQKTRAKSIVQGLVDALKQRVKDGVLTDEKALTVAIKAIVDQVIELGEEEALKTDNKALIGHIEATLSVLMGAAGKSTVKELDVLKTVIRTLTHEAYELGKGTK